MFTGLIKDKGRVVQVLPRDGMTQVQIKTALPEDEREIGESIACNGVCLTLTAFKDFVLSFDVIQTTLETTSLASWAPGVSVNLEPSLRLSDRLGGHLVQGHVDGTTSLIKRDEQGDDVRFWFERKPAWAKYLAPKGSIALDGISLTLSAVEPDQFCVSLIPETLERTNLGELHPGNRVNVEVDLIARYLEALGSAPGD